MGRECQGEQQAPRRKLGRLIAVNGQEWKNDRLFRNGGKENRSWQMFVYGLL